MTLHVFVFHNLTYFIQKKGEGPQRQMILFLWLISTPHPNFTPIFTALNGIYGTSSTSVTILPLQLLQGGQLLLSFADTLHICVLSA